MFSKGVDLPRDGIDVTARCELAGMDREVALVMLLVLVLLLLLLLLFLLFVDVAPRSTANR